MPEKETKIKDYTAEVAEQLPKLIAPAKENPDLLNDALLQLMTLEKKTRLAADAFSTSKVAVAILELCAHCKNWNALTDSISILSKRRAQMQKVQEAVVQTGVKLLAQCPDDATKKSLIESLRTVSAGKIFVELERARLTLQLSQMEEAKGNVAAAADILQEVAVETIGTMEAREKAEFLLEQLRLMLAKKDYVRTEIIAKKVDRKQLREEGFQPIKVRFYKLMIQYYEYHGQYLECALAWDAIYHTPTLQADPHESAHALSALVIFSLLAPYDAEVAALQARTSQEKQLSKLPAFAALLQEYTGEELMQWPLTTTNHEEVDRNPVFRSSSTDYKSEMRDDTSMTDAVSSISALTVHSPAKRWSDLRVRIIQRNLRVLSRYYRCIRSERLASLLSLTEDEAEKQLSELVWNKQIAARINRPKGEVVFIAQQTSTETLSTFTHDISELLSLVDRTCHQITKETMLHQIKV